MLNKFSCLLLKPKIVFSKFKHIYTSAALYAYAYLYKDFESWFDFLKILL